MASLLNILHSLFDQINSLFWGPPMLILILGTGFFLMVTLKLIPLRKLGYGFNLMWQGRISSEKGDVTPFNALMVSLAATIGTGNIAGVATAIHIGGPGALFWMWCTALVGMATQYSEAVCAVHYRETDSLGNHVGGPMYYIKNGLGPRWLWLGTVFAMFGAIASFGIGNTIQANSVAGVLTSTFDISPIISGLVMAVIVWLVLIGGIRRIAEVSGKLVPFMAITYIIGGLVILGMNITLIPSLLELIIVNAFTGTAATGGFAGASVWLAIRYGVARGIFSNEAGLGSTPIAHAMAQTNSPVQQGLIAMVGTFLDTIVVCSITGFVIILSGFWTGPEKGAALSSLAFEHTLIHGQYLVTFGLTLFAFTTILGWSVYGEKCVQYLFGNRSIPIFRWLWVLAVPIGAIMKFELIWLIADTLNAMMAIPNLIALLLLSPVILRLTKDYFSSHLK